MMLALQGIESMNGELRIKEEEQ